MRFLIIFFWIIRCRDVVFASDNIGRIFNAFNPVLTYNCSTIIGISRLPDDGMKSKIRSVQKIFYTNSYAKKVLVQIVLFGYM